MSKHPEKPARRSARGISQLTGRHTQPTGLSSGFGRLKRDKPLTKPQHWRRDLHEKFDENERLARDALSTVPKLKGFASTKRPKPRDLTGLLDPHYAAGERGWHYCWARHWSKDHKRRLRRSGCAFQTFATTVTPPRWLVRPEEFNVGELRVQLPKWRKQIQRWAKRLPAGSFTVGAIDVAKSHDLKTGLVFWAFHVHVLILLPCKTVRAGKKLIRKAFRIKNRADLGVHRAIVSKPTSKPKGGARGWLRYSNKSFQLHPVHRRVVPFNAETGERKKALKQKLRPDERAQWAQLALHLRADDLMIWVGLRRYGDKVCPMRGRVRSGD